MPVTSSSTVATEHWVNCYDKRSREPMGALKMVSLGLIVIGVVGLHLSSGVR
jgi:hypothetical protein